MCNRKSEISALVEKKTGFEGNRTLIQGGFFAWCRAGSIFAQDISTKSYNVKNVTKVKLERLEALTIFINTWLQPGAFGMKQPKPFKRLGL